MESGNVSDPASAPLVPPKELQLASQQPAQAVTDAAKPFETVSIELFEAILRFLPRQDIVKARNVCKEFRHNVDNSPTLRRAIFIAPSAEHIRWVAEKQEGENLEGNIVYPARGKTHLRAKGGKLHTGTQALSLLKGDPPRVLGSVRPITFNPLLIPAASPGWFTTPVSTRLTDYVDADNQNSIKFSRNIKVLRAGFAAGCPKDSIYMRMFITSPPITKLGYIVQECYTRGKELKGWAMPYEKFYNGFETVTNAKGVMWPDLIDPLKKQTSLLKEIQVTFLLQEGFEVDEEELEAAEKAGFVQIG
ncbi:hypothetical protein MBLNU230_g5218t1 [Neophaeotheca triangularis]